MFLDHKPFIWLWRPTYRYLYTPLYRRVYAPVVNRFLELPVQRLRADARATHEETRRQLLATLQASQRETQLQWAAMEKLLLVSLSGDSAELRRQQAVDRNLIILERLHSMEQAHRALLERFATMDRERHREWIAMEHILLASMNTRFIEATGEEQLPVS
jgi:hypothetical protein